MADFKQMLTVERNSQKHELSYYWALDQEDLATNEAKLLDWGDIATLAEIVEKIDHFCPTISETKKAVIALMENDKLILKDEF